MPAAVSQRATTSYPSSPNLRNLLSLSQHQGTERRPKQSLEVQNELLGPGRINSDSGPVWIQGEPSCFHLSHDIASGELLILWRNGVLKIQNYGVGAFRCF